MGQYNPDMVGMCRLYLTMVLGSASMIDANKTMEKDFKEEIYYYYEKTIRNLSLGVCNSC